MTNWMAFKKSFQSLRNHPMDFGLRKTGLYRVQKGEAVDNITERTRLDNKDFFALFDSLHYCHGLHACIPAFRIKFLFTIVLSCLSVESDQQLPRCFRPYNRHWQKQCPDPSLPEYLLHLLISQAAYPGPCHRQQKTSSDQYDNLSLHPGEGQAQAFCRGNVHQDDADSSRSRQNRRYQEKSR